MRIPASPRIRLPESGFGGQERGEVKEALHMKTRTFANVWDALSDSPEEAATMKIRSDVMIGIHDTIRAWDTTQAQAAIRLGVTQPRLNDLLQGKINKFSLDTLLTLAGRAGLKVKINIKSAA